MVLKKEPLLKTVIDGLMMLKVSCEGRGKLGLVDLNHLAEAFFCRFLNEAYDLELKVLKTGHSAIDLADAAAGVAYQITSDNTKAKIQETLKNFATKKLFLKYPSIKILIIGNRKEKYSLRIPNEVTFDDASDVFDIRTIGEDIKRMKTAKVKKLADIVNEEIQSANILSKPIPKKRVARSVIGSIAVDRFGKVAESDECVAELLSKMVLKYESSKMICRIQVNLACLNAIQIQLKRKLNISADHKIHLVRRRRDLMVTARRIERSLTLLALSARYSLPIADKTKISRTIVRRIFELSGLVDDRSTQMNLNGHTIDIFSRASPYPRQLQIEANELECEEIEKKLGFPVVNTLMNGQPCSLLPTDFLWFRAYPTMIVATVWFEAYPNNDRLAAEKCDRDNWLFGLS